MKAPRKQSRSWGAILADRLNPPTVDAFAVLRYAPTPRQQEFHDSTADDVLFGGSAGPGKTLALVMHGIRACVDYPGIAVLGIVRSIAEIERTFEAKLAQFGYAKDLGAEWSVGRKELTFPNGSRMKFTYVTDVSDAINLQGSEWQLILIDERTLIPADAVDLVVSRLRSRRGGPPVLGVRSASNPGGIAHGAVKARFLDATEDGAKVYTDEFGRTVQFIRARFSDNPHLDDGYERTLNAIRDPMRRKALRDGSWYVWLGQAFPDWDERRHVVDPIVIPDSWPLFGAADYGYRNPWAWLLGAVDEDGRLWLTKELYGVEVGESEQASRIVEALGGNPAALVNFTMVVDPSMFARRGDAPPIAEAYKRAGLWVSEADNSRISGKSRVHELLAEAPACAHHRARGVERCPMLHVFSTCRNFIRTFPALIVDDRKPEDVDTRGEDHLYDCLRYLSGESARYGGGEFVSLASIWMGRPSGPDMRTHDGRGKQIDWNAIPDPTVRAQVRQQHDWERRLADGQ